MEKAYKEFVNSLKAKYGDTYLASATKEEQEKFIKLFATVSHISELEAQNMLQKFVTIQKNNMYSKPYMEYSQSLESRLGVYYFIKLNSNERDKLIDLYTKYMKSKVKGYTKDLAFMDLYNKEKEKYEKIRNEAENSLHILSNMIASKQIGIDELLKR